MMMCFDDDSFIPISSLFLVPFISLSALHCTWQITFLFTMRLFLSSFLLYFSSWSTTDAFVHQHQQNPRGGRGRGILSSFPSNTALFADNNNNNGPNVDRMKELIQEEASDSNMMKAAAEQMKNLTPGKA
jgi:hypothetical protein